MYNIPKILNESIEILRGITNNVDDLAILNCLNAKFANMITQKNIHFKQFSNSSPRTLSYYAMNFQPSGSSKDFVVDSINEYLMPFIQKELDDKIEEYKQRYEYEQGLTRIGKKAEKQIQEEIARIRVSNFEVSNCTFTGLYKECYQINEVGFGSICIRISELGDFISLAQAGDKGKAELFSKMKEIYEGNIMPSIISGESNRKTLNGINVQAILYTDYNNLFDEKVKEYYLSALQTGLSRRAFIFIPAEKNNKLDYIIPFEEKEQQFEKAKSLQKEIKFIYDMIKPNAVYQLSEESKKILIDYQNSCIDYFNNTKELEMIKLEKLNSFWKITKLAVVYSIIDNPTNNIVSSKYVQMAIDFYNLISPSLKRVIEKRKKSEIERFAEYMANKSNDVITRTELRETGIVSSNKFKRFFDEHLDEIKEELENTYGYNLYDYNGKGNIRAFQCMKVR